MKYGFNFYFEAKYGFNFDHAGLRTPCDVVELQSFLEW